MAEFTTSVGRIVWGHPLKPRAVTDRKTKAPKLNASGQPRQAWVFGVAFPKADFSAYIWPVLVQEVSTKYPPTAHTNGQPSAPGKFSWKYVDGDGLDDDHKPWSDREGYAGCYVLTFSTELKAPGVFQWDGTKYNQLPAEAIKTGDYVVVGGSCKINVPTDPAETPGLYINPEGVQFIGYGPEIIAQGGADPMAMFKGQQYALPAGASATPVGGASVGMPGVGGGMQPGQPQPGMMAAPAPAPMMAPAPAPMAAPAPMMAPQPAPMAAPAPVMAAPAPVGPQRPTDPTHIGRDPSTGAEMWWNGAAWTPAPVMPAPAPDFVANAGMPAPAPMMAPAPTPMAAPAPGMPQPGMMAPR
jgi:hypothetical protein